MPAGRAAGGGGGDQGQSDPAPLAAPGRRRRKAALRAGLGPLAAARRRDPGEAERRWAHRAEGDPGRCSAEPSAVPTAEPRDARAGRADIRTPGAAPRVSARRLAEPRPRESPPPGRSAPSPLSTPGRAPMPLQRRARGRGRLPPRSSGGRRSGGDGGRARLGSGGNGCPRRAVPTGPGPARCPGPVPAPSRPLAQLRASARAGPGPAKSLPGAAGRLRRQTATLRPPPPPRRGEGG